MLTLLGMAGRAVALHLGPHLMGCRRWPELLRLLGAAGHRGAGQGAAQRFARRDSRTAGLEAVKTGCWLNMADVDDFMVAQPWLKGVEQAHVVTNPNSLRLAALSVG